MGQLMKEYLGQLRLGMIQKRVEQRIGKPTERRVGFDTLDVYVLARPVRVGARTPARPILAK